MGGDVDAYIILLMLLPRTRYYPRLVIPWTLVVFLLSTPHTLPLQLRPALGLPIFVFQMPKLRS